MSMHCPVCLHANPAPFMRVEDRDYWRCPQCQATFLDPQQLPAPAIEHAHYRTHRNEVTDPGYRRFLARLADPLCAKLNPGLEGLDYGCGPGPALADMLTQAGHSMQLYDPLFPCDADALHRQYDFITCTEVVEHFHRPADEFARFDQLLRPNGWLAIMTLFQTDDQSFANWHYRRDPTHVVFYRPATFHVLAEQYGWHCEIPAKDVVLLRQRNH